MIVSLLYSACLTTVYLLVLIFFLFCCWYIKLIKTYWCFPSKRMELWIINILTGFYPRDATFTGLVFKHIVKQCRTFQKEGYCILWFFRPYMIFFGEEFSKMFFNEPAIVDKSSLYEIGRLMFGNSLLLSNGDIWKKHRKIMNPVFYVGALKCKLHIFNEHGADLTKKLENFAGQPTTEIPDLLKCCSFNALTETVLGVNLSDEKYKSKKVKYIEIIHNLTEEAISRIVHPWLQWTSLLPLFPDGRKHIRVCRELHNFMDEMIYEMKKSVEKKHFSKESDDYDQNRKSLTEVLLEQHLKDPTFTMEDIRGQITTIVTAGHDTTAYTLTWCLYMLGTHPLLQDKVINEINSVVLDTDVTYDNLCKLKYLDCFIKETLRLYSVAPLYGRMSTKDLKIGDKIVPKGTEIIISPYLLHRNPDVYADPEKFDPERFSENSKIPPWNYIPFAEGYRSCIGKKFAMMEIKVFLVHILQRFSIKALDTVEESDFDWNVVLSTQKPVRMLFTTRRRSSLHNGG